MANIFNMLLAGLAQQDPPTDVEGIDVVAKLPPKPVQATNPSVVQAPVLSARNPFSDEYIQAAQQASQAQAQLPRVNPGPSGLWGFMPEKVQSGRIRDILGAIGDGLLIGSGAQPQYQPRIDRLKAGQSMIGYDQDPNAALERLMATGTPGAMDNARVLLGNLQTTEARKQVAEQQAQVKQEVSDLRRDTILQTIGQKIIPGLLATIKSPEDYEVLYPRLQALATKYGGGDTDPMTAWGLPGPFEWTEGMTNLYGTTGGEQLRASTTREGISQRREAEGIRSSDRRAAIGQRATAASQASADRRYAVDNKPKTGTGAKPTPKAGAKPAAKATPAASAGAKKPDATMIKAYQGGTPAQRAQARAAWRAQGYDVRNLK